ncbi:hypothetical protein CVF48_20920 [Salmonella enterica]|nr:hypothetical protein [Salmonella enterica]EBD6355418.1 hypothetical protein [Salmonella enterica]
MKMQELPVEVQTIAASTLRRKMKINDQRADKEPVTKLAHEVREAFISLFSERVLQEEKKAAAEKVAATILGLQQLVSGDAMIKAQVGHLISAIDDLLDKNL